ncbi:MAG: cell wall hydrolase [Pseudobdellovibrionaceae bacterium]
MGFFSAFLSIYFGFSQAFSQEMTSSVYDCRFQNNLATTQSLRMKDYFDAKQGQRAGKVDLLENLMLIESTPTLVYQIPLEDQKTYVQIWYSSTVRVDSQMSLEGSNKNFSATYHKGSLKEDLFCTTLSP